MDVFSRKVERSWLFAVIQASIPGDDQLLTYLARQMVVLLNSNCVLLFKLSDRFNPFFAETKQSEREIKR